ncbi:ribosome maturation factor RimM [Derxia gummosa]|uniref:Ribosome maturation factor RimM n=1 Tax=Derxia gummosa DSM 723 TaxID=1121388 RepID=A0A8B6XB08_9BURK|nr:ribosome maturation factor RimM [Derxia gummosa]
MTSTVTQSVPGDLVVVARIVGAYGVKGWIKVEAFSAEASALQRADRWWIAPRDSGRWQLRECHDLKPHSGQIVARIEGCADRDTAEALRGHEIAVSRGDFPEPEPNAYYWVDLLGCEVVAESDGKAAGKVVNLIDNGAHSILEVQVSERDGKPVTELIPFVDAYLRDVNIAGRRIVVDWMFEPQG